MGKAAENKLLKQERLFDIAFDLFTSQGITKTSIADIVDSAGVAKGTFYLYFRDKYDLAQKLVVRKARNLFEKAVSEMNQMNLETPEDKIIAITDSVLNELERTPTLLRFIDKNLSWGLFEKALHRNTDESEFLSNLLTIFGDLDEWKDVNTMLYLIIELVGSSCHSVILEKDPMDLETFKPHLFTSIRAIIQTFRKQ